MRTYIITFGLTAALASGAAASNNLGYGPLSDMDAAIAKHFAQDAQQLSRTEEARKPALAASAIEKGIHLEMAAQERAALLEAQLNKLSKDNSPEAQAQREQLEIELSECVSQMEAGRILARMGQASF